MARIRYLKPDFFKDEDIKDLPFKTRLVFAGLWTQADRDGRGEDRPERLKVEIMPYNKVNIDTELSLLSRPKKHGNKPYIIRYEVSGQKYFQILEWHKHQKPHPTERQSLIPPPPKEILDNLYLTVKEPLEQSGDGDGDGEGKVLTHRLSDNDFLNTLKTNLAYKHIDIDRELAKMDAWITVHRGRQKTRKFIVNWLNKVDKPLEVKQGFRQP